MKIRSVLIAIATMGVIGTTIADPLETPKTSAADVAASKFVTGHLGEPSKGMLKITDGIATIITNEGESTVLVIGSVKSKGKIKPLELRAQGVVFPGQSGRGILTVGNDKLYADVTIARECDDISCWVHVEAVYAENGKQKRLLATAI